MNLTREYSAKRFSKGGVTCPLCRAKVGREVKWCERCSFTGSKTLEMFGDTPPPLQPILDVADYWTERDCKKIERAVQRFNKRFPQIRWRFCAVALDPEISMPLFGFWIMNVCPLGPEETAEQREWTILFLVDSDTGRVSITTGYKAEIWLTEEMWEKALAETNDPLARGKNGLAVVSFLESAVEQFSQAWKLAQTKLHSERHS